MRISLITTLPSLVENQRLKEEAEKLGHKLEIINTKSFNFSVQDNKLDLPGITDNKSDLVIFRGIFTSIRSYRPLIKYLRQQGIKVFDNNLHQHQYSINKVTDLLKLSLAGIPVPNAIYESDLQNFTQNAKKIGFPLVVKTTRAGKGIGIYKFDDESKLNQFIDSAEKEGKTGRGLIMQEFIPYAHDLRILIIGSKQFTMKRIPSKNEFRANFSLGGSVELFQPTPETEKLAQDALNAVNMSIGGVDVLITKENKQYILEVNHTAGFIGMEKAYQKNIAKTWLEHAIKSAK